jgi:hypothetical protein
MKKLFSLFVMTVMSLSVFSQSPEKMSYQAVIRNASNTLVTSQVVGMRISILQGSAIGPVVYTETQTPTTNINGLVSIEIGGGAGFNTINWASGPYFLKIETDPAGGINYTISGTSQLLSVPYALYSKTSGDLADNSVTSAKIVDGTIVAADLAVNAVTTDKINTGAVIGSKIAQAGAATGQALKWNGSTWAPGNDLLGNSLWTQSSSNIYYNDGDVGIGTSSPEGFLNIRGNSNTGFPQLLLTESESDYARLTFKNTVAPTKNWSIAGLPVALDGNSRLNFWYWNGSTGSDLMTITGNGHVGIGTVSPGAGLHIKAGSWPGSFIYLEADAAEDAGMRLYEGSDLKWHIYNDASVGGLIIQNYGLNISLFCQQSNGNVGIGTTTPGYKLTVNGTAWCSSGAWTGSDIRWKKNIKDLNNSLSRILELQAVNYDLRTDEFPEMSFETGTQIGLIAQDVEKVFPELVRTDNKGYKAVSYEKLSVLLVESIKEQQQQIDKQQKEIADLKSLVKDLINNKIEPGNN